MSSSPPPRRAANGFSPASSIIVDPGWAVDEAELIPGMRPLAAALTSSAELTRENHPLAQTGKEGSLASSFRRVLAKTRNGPVVVERHRTHELIPTFAAAAPQSEGSAVTASLLMSTDETNELTLTVGPLTGGRAVRVSVGQSFTVTAEAGHASLGVLAVPVWKEVRMVIPPGGHEPFPVADYWPNTEETVGLRQIEWPLDELEAALAAAGREPAPLEADNGAEGELRKQFSVDTTSGIALQGAASGFGATARLQGSATIAATWKIPAGRYGLHWMTNPAGCAITLS